MRVLDLFSGIGGFSLGLERAGMATVGFCEIEPFCRKVLAKHWPDVPCHDDITARVFTEGEADVVCGGFPCQDISNAGKRAGITGERSGLWRELVRAIRVVRPRYAIVENVAALLHRGMGVVLGDLAAGGYDAEWDCIPARFVGSPQSRDRLWIVGIANCIGQSRQVHAGQLFATLKKDEADSIKRSVSVNCPPRLGEVDSIPRMADGISRQLVRTRPKESKTAIGNAVVPQIPELIGRAIMQVEQTKGATDEA